ncbi:uncharacterized protein YbdZ (MbtH family) [Streptomyces sp. LBL]|nr:uncharacterized protein YbdZ (MbtH family) [Streptomyces sp. LBL]
MTNPFEDERGGFLVLKNEEGQHSLWPDFAQVPQGWRIVHPSDTRERCVAYIEENWIDMRPATVLSLSGRDRISAPDDAGRESLQRLGNSVCA